MGQASDFSGLWSAVVGGLAGGTVSFVSWGFKGRRDDVEKISDLFNDLKAETAVYWRGGGIDTQLEQAIIRIAQRASGKCYSYGRNYLSVAQYNAMKCDLRAVHVLVTGDGFGSATRCKDLPRISGISLQIDRVCEKLSDNWFWGTARRLGRFGR
jgi:hypothetical protein